jgi:hypothetical protein
MPVAKATRTRAAAATHAGVVSDGIRRLRSDAALAILAAGNRDAQAVVELGERIRVSLPDCREAALARAVAADCGRWLLRLRDWPAAIKQPLGPMREFLRAESPDVVWMLALAILAEAPGSTLAVRPAGRSGALIDGIMGASRDALAMIELMLAGPERPAEADSIRKGDPLGAVIDKYLEQLNRTAEDEDSATDARRKFLASGGKRMATVLRDAELLRPAECSDAKALEATANRIDTVCRRRADCKEARKPKAAAVPEADIKQVGGLYNAGASKRRIRTAEGKHDFRLCEECQTLPRGYGVDGAFCDLDAKQLTNTEQRKITTGERKGSWEGLAPHTLEEQRREAAEILGRRRQSAAVATGIAGSKAVS